MIVENLRMLPGWLQRLLAAACLACAAFGMSHYVLKPAASWIADQRAWQARSMAAIARDRALTGLAKDLAAQQVSLRQDSVWAALYQGSEVEIQRAMRADVSGIGTRMGIALAMESQPTRTEGSMRVYQLRVNGAMTMDQLVQWMRDLRQQSHALRIEGMRVSAPQTQPVNANAILQATFDVVGFSLAAGQQGSPL